MTSPEILGLNQAALDNEKGKWDALNEGIPKEGPLAAEFAQVQAEATSILQRLQMVLNDPNGQKIVEGQGEKLAELYRKAVEIRSKFTQQSMGGVLGGTQDDLTGVIEEKIEHATDPLPTAGRKALAADLKKISTALAVNPADVLEKTQPKGNLFFLRHYGNFGLNMDQIVKQEKFLKQVMEQGAAAPELVAVAKNLQAGIDKLKTQHQRQADGDAWYRQHFGFKMDTRPLRIMGGILGSIITTMGLAQTAFRKEHSFSPATAGWGILTAMLVRPDLFQGGSTGLLATMSAIGSTPVRQGVARGMKGEEGVQAFEELQTMVKNAKTKPKIDALLNSDQPITVAQLGALNDDPNSAFVTTMTKVPEADRRATLKTFAEPMDKGKTQLMTEMIRSGGIIS